MRPEPGFSRRRFLGWAGAFSAAIVAGCHPAPASGPPPRLAVLTAQLPYEPAQAAFATEAAAAAREAGATIAFEAGPLDALRAKLPSTAAAQQLPEVVLVGSADSTLLATRGLLRELGDSLDRIAGLNGDLFPPLNDLATAGPFVDRAPQQKASVWAIPFAGVGGAWLARRDLLAAKGLKLPKTFAEARTAAAALTDASAATFGWGASLPPGDGTDNLAQLALLAHGATFFDADGFQVVLDPAAVVPGLQALAGLYRGDDGAPLAPPDAVEWSPAQVEAAFAAGKTAQMIDAGGGYARLAQGNRALRAAIVALPPPAGPAGWFTATTTYAFAAPRGSSTPDAAIAWIERFLQPRRYERLVQVGQGMLIPPYAYLTKGPFWDDDPNYAVLVSVARGDPARTFQYANPGFPGPLTPPVALVRSAHVLSTIARSVVLGELPPAAAAEALRDRCVALAREALTIQPTPTPTPEPFWLRLIQPTPTSH